MIEQFRDPRLSLWQSAVDETLHRSNPDWTMRPDMAHNDKEGAILREVVQHCAEAAAKLPFGHPHSAATDLASLRGIPSAAAFDGHIIGSSADSIRVAETAIADGHDQANRLREELNFGNRDPRYLQAVTKYIQYFKLLNQPIKYVEPKGPGFSAEAIPDQCKIALVGDWGTGQQPAIRVLERIKEHNPDIIIHLGDIYYAGTEYEAESYFLKIFQSVFGIMSFGKKSRPRVLTMAGNHDMYAGGTGYYWLLNQIEQDASYFCLRNNHWNFVGVDTGFNDHNPFTVDSEATCIQSKELEWVEEQLKAAQGARTIFLSHHPLFSAFEDIAKAAINYKLLEQVKGLVPQITAWYWAHEHDQVIYQKYQNVHARLIGHGAFPIGANERKTPTHTEIPYSDIRLGNDGACYNHGYVLITLNGASGKAQYYECAGTEETAILTEQLESLH
ncbi:MAG: metallophosphoesterase [Candidatus Binataceae bacterium]|jgi:hypothetical protein